MTLLSADALLATPLEPRSVARLVTRYAQSDRDAWHAGQLLERVPEAERAKTRIKGRTDKYRSQCRQNHYGEVLAMIELARDGWQWLYDEYYLFWHAKHARHTSFEAREAWLDDRRGSVYRAGTRQLLEVVGRERMALLLLAGEHLRTATFRVTEPDLFAWKLGPDGRIRFRCIEVKVESDPIRMDQLVGMALIERVLGERCEVLVQSYLRHE